MNAGLSDGFVLDRNGSVKAVLSNCGPPLGILPRIDYSPGPEITLECGDVVVLMTDGIVEARDPLDNFLDSGQTPGLLDRRRRSGGSAPKRGVHRSRPKKICF